MSDVNQAGRWRETRRLAAAVLVAGAILVLFLLSIVEAPASIGYPLGFVLAASGVPGLLTVVVFWFAERQEATDRRHGLFED